MSIRYWLFKSEPNEYSIDSLKKSTKTWWTGIRNYQARNFMIKEMKIGDEILFYHSNANPSGVAGLARVCQPAAPDPSQFDSKSDGFDPKAKPESPRWQCVQVEFLEKFVNFISLEDLRKNSQLKSMMLLRKGQRLSIMPMEKDHFELICKLGRHK